MAKKVQLLELNLLKDVLRNTHTQNISLAGIDWDYFIQLTLRHRVLPQAYLYLKEIPVTPNDIIVKFARITNEIKFQNLSICGEVIRLIKLFKNAGVDYAIVKGIPLAEAVYGNYAIRQAKDIDILVSTVDVDNASTILKSLGYQRTRPEYELSGFKKRYYLGHKYDMEFFNSNKDIEIELHHNLNHIGLPFFKLSQMARKTIMLNNHAIETLNNEYHFLYLIVHAATHGWGRLRWLHDINLYRKHIDLDFEALIKLANSIGCVHILVQAFSLLQRIYGTDDSQIQFIISKYSDTNSIILTDLALEFIEGEYEICSDNRISDRVFIKYRFYYLFKLSTKKEKLNFFLKSFFMIDKLFPYITLPNKLSFLYYLLYPLVVLKYLIYRRL